MATRLREVLTSVEHILKFRIKVVERGGTPLARKFSLNKIWEGTKCGRKECVTCEQGGEQIPPCSKRNVVYENICVKCNPTAKEG